MSVTSGQADSAQTLRLGSLMKILERMLIFWGRWVKYSLAWGPGPPLFYPTVGLGEEYRSGRYD